MMPVVLLGPMLTTILGQLGGAWGGSKSRELGPGLDLAEVPRRGRRMERADGNLVDEWPGRTTLRPLGHAFNSASATCCGFPCGSACCLSLIRVCGIPYELILPLLMGWLLFQLHDIKARRAVGAAAWAVVGQAAAIPFHVKQPAV